MDFANLLSAVPDIGDKEAREMTIARIAHASGAADERAKWRKRLILQAESTTYVPVWVPVDEGLPPEGVRVLVYVPTCDLLPIQADEWNEQREDPLGMDGPTIATGHMWNEHEFDEVTHWMFLPTPPLLEPNV